MRYFLILNPFAGGGKSRAKISRLLSDLDAGGIEYDYREITSLDHARDLAAHANRNGYGTIVAVGGDGTINRVVNGFYDSDGKRISSSKLGVIHTGTSPDFCRSYGIPTEAAAAARTLSNGVSRRIDVGRIVYAREYSSRNDGCFVDTGLGNFVVEYFTCCSNIGFGAGLARRANSGIRKVCGDVPGTLLSLFSLLAGYRSNRYTCRFDGKMTNIGNVHNIMVGKSSHIASGIKVYTGISPIDRTLYNIVVKNLTVGSIVRTLRILYGKNGLESNEQLSLGYTRETEIAGVGVNNEVEFDGDPHGFLPCKISVADHSLDLIAGRAHA